MMNLNETHDASLRSWVPSADGHAEFPIQNLPFGVFRRAGTNEALRGGVAIGNFIVDLDLVARMNSLTRAAQQTAEAASQPTLNAMMALGPNAWSALRLALSRGLRLGAAEAASWVGALLAQDEAEFALPATVGDYTDFYTSVHHATSVGRLFRPDNPLLPNYKWVPIGYHGRSSTLGVSGQSFRRPKGQLMAPGEQAPELAPSRRMDYELEMGVFIGAGNLQGQSIAVDTAESHVFGMCLLNDWSARDIQSWEYQPLGPFLSKNFATTLSPWVVTMEALAPFRSKWTRPDGDPQPLPYLDSARVRECGSIDIALEVLMETPRMRCDVARPARLARTNFKHAYWTISQMVAHHTINGCSLRPGDLLGTGTQSGPGADEAGSLLELTQGGKAAIEFENGERRTFLEDGDTVLFRGWCEREGFARIGFGEVRGTMLPA